VLFALTLSMPSLAAEPVEQTEKFLSKLI